MSLESHLFKMLGSIKYSGLQWFDCQLLSLPGTFVLIWLYTHLDNSKAVAASGLLFEMLCVRINKSKPVQEL